jgi:hypothetical protein
MSEAASVIDDMYRKYGKCIIHAVSTSNARGLFDLLPFKIHATKQGIAFDGAERLTLRQLSITMVTLS